MAETAVIIVNYRTASLVGDCLASLAADGYVPRHGYVVVVDNCSGDDSLRVLNEVIARQGWTRWVEVVAADKNGGFAYGNNIGIQRTLGTLGPPEYILLLNPDTLVRPGAVAALANFLEANPDVGIVGAQLEDAQGQLVSSARRSPSPWSELNEGARLGPLARLLSHRTVALPVATEPLCCDWVSGAAMMVRREVFRQVGLLDEGYFLYYEELDFCDRARKAGWEIWQLPASRIMHLEGAATGIARKRVRRARYWYDSRRRYFLRQHGLWQWLAADLAWTLGRSTLLLRRLLHLGGHTQSDPRCLTLDLLGGDVRALLTGRAHKTLREPLTP